MSENILEEKKATDEYMLQALQTASCFAENVVKKLWCATLRKSSIELFGEEIPEISGEINIDAKPGSGMQSYALKLEIVSSTFSNLNLVELGVHDGMSAFFAASQLSENKIFFKLFLVLY